MDNHILVINPDSKSTKISVFNNRKQIFLITVKHDSEILSNYACIADQCEYRKSMIKDELVRAGIDINTINIIVGRGGLIKPIDGGIYKVNEIMIRDIKNPMGEHESNLGGLIANEIAHEIGNHVYAIIVDPTCVDELEEIARISGLPELPRQSLLHALNQKAVAQRFAKDEGKKYEEINVIVVHMGRGISAGAHYKGRIIDVNNALNGDGPMSSERSGGVPAGQLVELCFSGKYSQAQIMNKFKDNGGLKAYLGTGDLLEIEKRIINGDEHARLVHSAMAYQVAKEIGALSTVLKGDIDGIILTGEIAYSEMITSQITERVKNIGTVKIYPGDGEMEAMALSGYKVLMGEVNMKEYI